MKHAENFAFIDSTNLHLGIKALGWQLDYRRFRIYLGEKYGVTKAYIFIGFSPLQQQLYQQLQEYGYVIIFKPVMQLPDGGVKGNCDAELVLQAMIDIDQYQKAVIVTGDGDFYCLVNHLKKVAKFAVVLAPSAQNCSSLLRKAAGKDIAFVSSLNEKLAYKRKGPHADGTA
ncbi:hypothetical protein A3F28_02725 [Candidatus Uhrbacteria bacterium RIFCSPHIGHO2_12_FULL_57_11]|nr:MAG: hypothetical protein A3D72_04475 [Candidatus Uhrbacteria bacterium RIFCSPHIGHO2_02_FULL_57_19]OGL77545.1 MAG: hypothetical protein A3F28_02725 [Candidatus Uhrbacteria bacterium RIFCSPHIGHO2_12_FULL_57_11]